MPQLTPNLWFDEDGLEAAKFYVSVFPNSEVTDITYRLRALQTSPVAIPKGPLPQSTKISRSAKLR